LRPHTLLNNAYSQHHDAHHEEELSIAHAFAAFVLIKGLLPTSTTVTAAAPAQANAATAQCEHDDEQEPNREAYSQAQGIVYYL
jgi:hypothetical protein